MTGTMTSIGPDRARFDPTDPWIEPVPGGVEFRTANSEPELCA